VKSIVKKIPFDFILEELHALKPIVRPMFGCFAVYVKDKIVLALRNRTEYSHDNGVWLATKREYHESLRSDFRSIRTIRLFGNRESNWQNLPIDADSFEEDVVKACQFILKGDARIGTIPRKRGKIHPSKER
jgi:hypothetical protein